MAMTALKRPNIGRRRSQTVVVGGVAIGGNTPIAVQTASISRTADVAAAVAQVRMLADVGCDVVRMAVHRADQAVAIPRIREKLDASGCHVPLSGDLDVDANELLSNHPACARVLALYRIGGAVTRHDEGFGRVIRHAVELDKPVHIAVTPHDISSDDLAELMDRNAHAPVPRAAGVIVREAVVASALRSAHDARAFGLPADRLMLSCEMRDVQDLVFVYNELASRCDYPLHIALADAGPAPTGLVASAATLALLLQNGVGDSIHVYLPAEEPQDVVEGVLVSQEILQTMGLRAFSPLVSSCPGCGRTSSVVFQELADSIQSWLREQMPLWRQRYAGVETLSVAVMGCVVNGPGESRMANVGISLPGSGEVPVAPVYVDGEKTVTLKGANIAAEFQAIVHDYVRAKYGGEAWAAHLRPARRSIELVPKQ